MGIEQGQKDLLEQIKRFRLKKGEGEIWVLHEKDIVINASTFRELKNKFNYDENEKDTKDLGNN